MITSKKTISLYIKTIPVILVLLLFFTFLFSDNVFAADQTARVTIGKENIDENTVHVPITIDADAMIGSYYVEVDYDDSRLEYVAGADEAAEGMAVLTGVGIGPTIHYTLEFNVKSGGRAGLIIGYCSINVAGTENYFKAITANASYIKLPGTDNKDSSFKKRAEMAKAAAQAGVPLIGYISIPGDDDYYVIDQAIHIPEEVKWNYKTIPGAFAGTDVTYLTDEAENARILYVLGDDRVVTSFAVGPDQKLFPVRQFYDSKDKPIVTVPLAACVNVPDDIRSVENAAKYIVYGINGNGQGGYYLLNTSGRLKPWDESMVADIKRMEDEMSRSSFNYDLLWIIAAAGLIILLGGIFYLVFSKTRDNKRRQRLEHNRRKSEIEKTLSDEDIDFIDLESANAKRPKPEEKVQLPELSEEEKQEVVISVQDVSMTFNVAAGNVSGIKDYIISLITRKVKRKKFTALDHISFDVHKGEVVGIIGTNGSGKSTMLKIVSGSLSPSSGKVVVDRDKIQLLTIGTGFDQELTARENVYLNGAIIGYSRQFIDEHFDEIVEFAELENFMDERVKNFSSGMISRLGFAIATVANAAEILILDEVLAVGDEFFRKKSLDRVKEMIHSGSTALIVSHNIRTILDNCDRVIWLEKSKLRMVGDAETVCKAYRAEGYKEA